MSERDRFYFLVNRDGWDDAIEFARRTYKSYRKAVLMHKKRGSEKTHFASLPEYKPAFIRSYLYLKKQVMTYDNNR